MTLVQRVSLVFFTSMLVMGHSFAGSLDFCYQELPSLLIQKNKPTVDEQMIAIKRNLKNIEARVDHAKARNREYALGSDISWLDKCQGTGSEELETAIEQARSKALTFQRRQNRKSATWPMDLIKMTDRSMPESQKWFVQDIVGGIERSDHVGISTGSGMRSEIPKEFGKCMDQDPYFSGGVDRCLELLPIKNEGGYLANLEARMIAAMQKIPGGTERDLEKIRDMFQQVRSERSLSKVLLFIRQGYRRLGQVEGDPVISAATARATLIDFLGDDGGVELKMHLDFNSYPRCRQQLSGVLTSSDEGPTHCAKPNVLAALGKNTSTALLALLKSEGQSDVVDFKAIARSRAKVHQAMLLTEAGTEALVNLLENEKLGHWTVKAMDQGQDSAVTVSLEKDNSKVLRPIIKYDPSRPLYEVVPQLIGFVSMVSDPDYMARSMKLMTLVEKVQRLSEEDKQATEKLDSLRALMGFSPLDRLDPSKLRWRHTTKSEESEYDRLNDRSTVIQSEMDKAMESLDNQGAFHVFVSQVTALRAQRKYFEDLSSKNVCKEDLETMAYTGGRPILPVPPLEGIPYFALKEMKLSVADMRKIEFTLGISSGFLSNLMLVPEVSIWGGYE